MKFLKYAFFIGSFGISGASSFFGHVGVLSDFSIKQKERANFGGITTHLGYEFDHKGVVFGLGLYAGAGIFGDKVKLPNSKIDPKIENNKVVEDLRDTTQQKELYGNQYGDLSDLYLRYITGDLNIWAGRFNATVMQDDWVDAYAQGAMFKYGKDKAYAWGLWANRYTSYGASSNIKASHLAAYRPFTFAPGNKQLFSLGFSKSDKYYSLRPTINYYYNDNGDIFQASLSGSLKLGEGSPNTSITTARVVLQNRFLLTNERMALFWLDQELILKSFLKVGGGYMNASGVGQIYAPNDKSRFYSHKLSTPTNYHALSTFYKGGASVNYLFGGLQSDRFSFDVIKASGSFDELSVIGSVTAIKGADGKVGAKGVARSASSFFALKFGAGFIQSGEKKNAIVFTDMSF